MCACQRVDPSVILPGHQPSEQKRRAALQSRRWRRCNARCQVQLASLGHWSAGPSALPLCRYCFLWRCQYTVGVSREVNSNPPRPTQNKVRELVGKDVHQTAQMQRKQARPTLQLCAVAVLPTAACVQLAGALPTDQPCHRLPSQRHAHVIGRRAPVWHPGGLRADALAGAYQAPVGMRTPCGFRRAPPLPIYVQVSTPVLASRDGFIPSLPQLAARRGGRSAGLLAAPPGPALTHVVGPVPNNNLRSMISSGCNRNGWHPAPFCCTPED